MAPPLPDNIGASGAGGSRLKRLAWFVAYWVASVAALAVVAYAIRWAIR